MTIQVEWANAEKNIMIWHFRGLWSIEEFREATKQTFVLLEDVDHKFDLIFDAVNAKTPRFPMTEFQRALKIPVTKRDLLVIATTDMFITSLLSVLRRLGLPNMTRDRMAVVNTVAQAYETIASHREKQLSLQDA